jgi:hypothetical protein
MTGRILAESFELRKSYFVVRRELNERSRLCDRAWAAQGQIKRTSSFMRL